MPRAVGVVSELVWRLTGQRRGVSRRCLSVVKLRPDLATVAVGSAGFCGRGAELGGAAVLSGGVGVLRVLHWTWMECTVQYEAL